MKDLADKLNGLSRETIERLKREARDENHGEYGQAFYSFLKEVVEGGVCQFIVLLQGFIGVSRLACVGVWNVRKDKNKAVVIR